MPSEELVLEDGSVAVDEDGLGALVECPPPGCCGPGPDPCCFERVTWQPGAPCISPATGAPSDRIDASVPANVLARVGRKLRVIAHYSGEVIWEGVGHNPFWGASSFTIRFQWQANLAYDIEAAADPKTGGCEIVFSNESGVGEAGGFYTSNTAGTVPVAPVVVPIDASTFALSPNFHAAMPPIEMYAAMAQQALYAVLIGALQAANPGINVGSAPGAIADAGPFPPPRMTWQTGSASFGPAGELLQNYPLQNVNSPFWCDAAASGQTIALSPGPPNSGPGSRSVTWSKSHGPPFGQPSISVVWEDILTPFNIPHTGFPVTGGRSFTRWTGSAQVTALDPCAPDPVGACCVHLTGACIPGVTQAACNSPWGSWQGAGSVCTPSPCPVPLGACCSFGNCTVTSQAACEFILGLWLGLGTSCVPNNCPTIGACCLEEFGVCSPGTSYETCIATGGLFLGNGTTCPNSNCPQGACCLLGGGCVMLGPGGCAPGTGNNYLGNGTQCFVDPCPEGACCLPGGVCVQPPGAAACASLGGSWVPGYLCAQVLCMDSDGGSLPHDAGLWLEDGELCSGC